MESFNTEIEETKSFNTATEETKSSKMEILNTEIEETKNFNTEAEEIKSFNTGTEETERLNTETEEIVSGSCSPLNEISIKTKREQSIEPGEVVDELEDDFCIISPEGRWNMHQGISSISPYRDTKHSDEWFPLHDGNDTTQSQQRRYSSHDSKDDLEDSRRRSRKSVEMHANIRDAKYTPRNEARHSSCDSKDNLAVSRRRSRKSIESDSKDDLDVSWRRPKRSFERHANHRDDKKYKQRNEFRRQPYRKSSGVCFQFLDKKCYRGSSCRFLHQDVGEENKYGGPGETVNSSLNGSTWGDKSGKDAFKHGWGSNDDNVQTKNTSSWDGWGEKTANKDFSETSAEKCGWPQWGDVRTAGNQYGDVKNDNTISKWDQLATSQSHEPNPCNWSNDDGKKVDGETAGKTSWNISSWGDKTRNDDVKTDDKQDGDAKNDNTLSKWDWLASSQSHEPNPCNWSNDDGKKVGGETAGKTSWNISSWGDKTRNDDVKTNDKQDADATNDNTISKWDRLASSQSHEPNPCNWSNYDGKKVGGGETAGKTSWNKSSWGDKTGNDGRKHASRNGPNWGAATTNGDIPSSSQWTSAGDKRAPNANSGNSSSWGKWNKAASEQDGRTGVGKRSWGDSSWGNRTSKGTVTETRKRPLWNGPDRRVTVTTERCDDKRDSDVRDDYQDKRHKGQTFRNHSSWGGDVECRNNKSSRNDPTWGDAETKAKVKTSWNDSSWGTDAQDRSKFSDDDNVGARKNSSWNCPDRIVTVTTTPVDDNHDSEMRSADDRRDKGKTSWNLSNSGGNAIHEINSLSWNGPKCADAVANVEGKRSCNDTSWRINAGNCSKFLDDHNVGAHVKSSWNSLDKGETVTMKPVDDRRNKGKTSGNHLSCDDNVDPHNNDSLRNGLKWGDRMTADPVNVSSWDNQSSDQVGKDRQATKYTSTNCRLSSADGKQDRLMKMGENIGDGTSWGNSTTINDALGHSKSTTDDGNVETHKNTSLPGPKLGDTINSKPIGDKQDSVLKTNNVPKWGDERSSEGNTSCYTSTWKRPKLKKKSENENTLSSSQHRVDHARNDNMEAERYCLQDRSNHINTKVKQTSGDRSYRGDKEAKEAPACTSQDKSHDILRMGSGVPFDDAVKANLLTNSNKANSSSKYHLIQDDSQWGKKPSTQNFPSQEKNSTQENAGAYVKIRSLDFLGVEVHNTKIPKVEKIWNTILPPTDAGRREDMLTSVAINRKKVEPESFTNQQDLYFKQQVLANTTQPHQSWNSEQQKDKGLRKCKGNHLLNQPYGDKVAKQVEVEISGEDNEVEASRGNTKKVTDEEGIDMLRFAIVRLTRSILMPAVSAGYLTEKIMDFIVDKVVAKAVTTLKDHNIPHSWEHVDSYVTANESKLRKLVEAYCAKHSKK